ncbi:hypothetical protein NO1_0542 [Candidatus Termititenax aidoneus]|uniref:Uncharacterized protein n=1 Tax=Termititenax aidoneus TaxID=2218524 RepID=A0A388TA24_TERA1|nr:hypothetical protein NO1_0542 [Candidatus Termititenax aidoneus]
MQAAPGLSPTLAEIRSSDNDCAAFTWHQPEINAGQEITGYYVYWGADEAGVSDFFQNNNFQDNAARSFDPPPVQDFGEYYLRVRAVDEAGHSGGWATVLTYIYEDETETLAELEEEEYTEEEYAEEYSADEETESAEEEEIYFAETAGLEEAAEVNTVEGDLLAVATQMSGGDFVISNASFVFEGGGDNPFVRPIQLPPIIFSEDGVRYQDEEIGESPQVAMRPIQLPSAVIADAADAGTEKEIEYTEEYEKKTEEEILEEIIAAAETERANGAVFNPELPLTRKEMFKMVVYMLEEQGLPLPEKTVPQFSDLSAEHLTLAEKAARYGLLRGFPDGTARLDQPLRKAEAACIFARYNTAVGENLAGVFLSAQVFIDVPSAHWAYQEIAQTREFFTSSAENYFQPQAEISRLDTAKMLAKFKYVQDRREDLPPLSIGQPAPAAGAAENAQVSHLPEPGKEQ